MPIVLTLHKARDPSDRQRESRTLDEGVLSIGRGPSNNWVLQDPAQHLSKVHCVVSSTPGGHVLTDCSSNGVFLNGAKKRMERDAKVPLADGDEFVLGDYLVQVSEVASLTSRAVASSAGATPRGAAPVLDGDDPFGLDEFLPPRPAPAPPPPPPPPRAAPRVDPFADPEAMARQDPFGDSFDDALLPSAPAAAARPFGEPLPKVAPAGQRDPFDLRDEKQQDAFGDDDDDLFRGAKPAVSWEGPSQPDTVDGSAQAFIAPKAIPMPNMDDWDDLLGDVAPGVSPPAPPPPPPVPVAAPPPVAPAVPTPPVAMVPPAPPPAAAEGDAAMRLLAAFLDGAGVAKLDVSAQDPESYFRGVGELFGLMVESLRDVLMSRAVTKGEFGVEQTMLRPRNNNALKFSVTPSDAVAALLQPGRPGYMQPLAATKEAFDDVRIHQLAVMAGVQAALFNLLKTFDPAALEGRLQKGSMLGNIMPGARRAKLWDAFCAAYKEIARDADSDFQAVFGREFARAYNEQAGQK